MTPLVQVAIQALPSILDLARSLFHQQNPTAPTPTDAEVMAAFEQAYQSSVAKDNAWLAAHPPRVK